MKPGVVTFCGAGPGAPDLLTVRAHRALREADVLVFAGSLVSPEVVACARPECERHDSAAMHLEAIVEILVDRARAGKRVLRLHTGDPSVYGAIAEQMRMLDAAGVPYETIPGVSAAFAAAAALNAELTLPGVTQTVVLSRMAGRTPVPEPESLRALSRIGATMALYLSVGRIESVVEELVAEGRYDVNTPVAVVYRVGWPDQRVVRGTLGDIAAKVREAGIGRQAVILVGAALSGAGESSLLYDAAFSHGFREGRRGLPGVAPAAPDETGRARFTRFGGRVAVYALTEAGCVAARRLAALLDAQAFVNRRFAGAGSDAAVPFDADGFADLVAWNWKRFDAHVFVMAAGIVVRVIARLLASKEHDPAVVVADECLQFAQSLLSGHLGGANRLCRDIERLSGAKAVISTATDTHGVCAWDEFAAMKGYQVADAASIAPLNLALLEKKPIAVLGADESDLEILRQIEHLRPVRRLDEAADAAAVVTIDCECPAGPWPRLHLKRLPLVVGVGCQRGVPAAQIERAIRNACERYGVDFGRITALASVSLKRDERGLLEVAARHGWETRFEEPSSLDARAVPHPSAFVSAVTGSASVAEAAAVSAGEGRLIVPKQREGGVTVAIATRGRLVAPGAARKRPEPARTGRRIAVVGIGPGTREGLTRAAEEAILGADWVVGYRSYCRQLAWLTAGKNVFETGMRSEIERCDKAVELAAAGQAVALVCSGDAGIYGLAGLVFERMQAAGRGDIEVRVIPGVTAATQAASVVGAPLVNDFACISLSDLLTPREVILRRIEAVARADMVCALYNPRSVKRRALLEAVLGIFERFGGGDLPAATVRHAGRREEAAWVGRLRELEVEAVDMNTLVIIGNSQTRIIDGKLITLRGYERKPEYASSVATADRERA